MSMIDRTLGRRAAQATMGALAAGAIAWSAVPGAARADQALADMVEKVSPAVVTVFSTQEAQDEQGLAQQFGIPPGSPFEDFLRRFGNPNGGGEDNGGSQPRQALGSGFILDASGYVITNNHVVEDASSVKIQLNDKHEYTAKIVGTDPQTDLALLKIEADGKLPTLTLGDSKKLRVGDDVFAVGNPFGLGWTVTSGIVSALARDINSGPYVDFIQTDAAINRGNSGGPLFNDAGEVIGVNSAIISPTGGSVGVGFAIPSEIVKRVVADLKDHGSVARGWLGVAIQNVTPDIASALGMKDASGAIVANVMPDGPSNGKLERGDVILKFDGQKVAESRDLPKLVGATAAGKTVDVEVLRDGKDKVVQVEIGTLPDQKTASNDTGAGKDEETASEKLGASLAALTPDMRKELGLDDAVGGAVVTSLKGDGAAAQAGVQVGDVILRVGSENVTGPAELDAALKKVETPSALLLINRRGNELFLGVKLA